MQHAQMFGDLRLAQPQLIDQIPDWPWAIEQQLDNL